MSRSLACVTVGDGLAAVGALIPVQGRKKQKKGKAFSELGSCSYVSQDEEQAIRCVWLSRSCISHFQAFPLAFVIGLTCGLGFSEQKGNC